MVKLLINCSFNYIQNGLQYKDNYALFLDFDPAEDLERAIYDKLKTLNWKMPDYRPGKQTLNHGYKLSFTAQQIM